MAKVPLLGLVVVIALVAMWQQSGTRSHLQSLSFLCGLFERRHQCPSLTPLFFLCAYKSQCAIKCERKMAQRILLLKRCTTKYSKEEQLDDGVKWWQEIKLNFVLGGNFFFFRTIL